MNHQMTSGASSSRIRISRSDHKRVNVTRMRKRGIAVVPRIAVVARLRGGLLN